MFSPSLFSPSSFSPRPPVRSLAAEVDALLGDARKARAELGWQPEVSFEELVDEMVAHDLELAPGPLCPKPSGNLA